MLYEVESITLKMRISLNVVFSWNKNEKANEMEHKKDIRWT